MLKILSRFVGSPGHDDEMFDLYGFSADLLNDPGSIAKQVKDALN